MLKSLPSVLVLLFSCIHINATGNLLSVHEQLYDFTTTFREIKPTLLNQDTTWHELQYLLESGASFKLADIDINTRHRATGTTMLYCATRTGCLQTAYYLLDQGASPNLQDTILGNAPLHAAAEKGFDDLITRLCTHTANPNIANHDGQTPLHKAVLAQQPTAVAALLKQKAYRHIADKYGKQPIDYAKARGYDAIIALLSAH